jgi:hypothetical protein
MIIFQATPSRLFPVVIESILNQTNIEHNEFHYPYIVKKYEDWLKPNNILAGIPKESLHVRTNGFLYGVFSSTHLNLENNDFVFTLLNHPVDQVYECFTYLKFTQDQIGPRNDENLEKNPQDRYFAEIEVFKMLEGVTLEKFVDLVLEDFDFSFKYKDIDYMSIKENIYGFSDFSQFSHVGKYSDLETTFKKLSEVFQCELKAPEVDKTLAFNGDFYRRSDLEKKFKQQMDLYEKISTNS